MFRLGVTKTTNRQCANADIITAITTIKEFAINLTFVIVVVSMKNPVDITIIGKYDSYINNKAGEVKCTQSSSKRNKAHKSRGSLKHSKPLANGRSGVRSLTRCAYCGAVQVVNRSVKPLWLLILEANKAFLIQDEV